MFDKSLETIFTIDNLQSAFSNISKNSLGIDEVDISISSSQQLLQKLQSDIVSNNYSPEPIKKIDIKKEHSNETRPIGISSLKDKIVQKVLYNELNIYFDKTFENNSYAYRPNKSTSNAINRVTQYLNEKNFSVLKTDIDNFFENINHDILIDLLKSHIKDDKIVKLIELFINIGSFKKLDYNDHSLGVYQGDILSPLLSNIYLDQMDKFLVAKDISFVRYADDFIILAKNKNDLTKIKYKLELFLKDIHLNLGDDKTYISHIKDGFVFLGVKFQGRNKTVDNERFQKKLTKLRQLSKSKMNFETYIIEINDFLLGLKNHYLKVISKDSKQYDTIKKTIIETIANKIYISKESKQIKKKTTFYKLLEQINLQTIFDINSIENIIKIIVSKGFEKYLENKTYKDDVKSKVSKKKNEYSKKFANDSTLHIATFGVMLGISKNRIVIKEYGKVKNSYPIDKIKRVILEGKGYSLSSDVIKKCADNNITIDFIDKNLIPYASLTTYNASVSQTIHKQSLLINQPIQLTLAKAFIKGKAKNQINYIKYLNKYHDFLDDKIDKMEQILQNSKKAKTINEIMGYEGSLSIIYWSSLKLVLEVPFEKRITKGAKDIVNSSLNYAYAILYGKVQQALVTAGLSLNISFLHSLDNEKPTLTFDMIEEFRTFIVDRTIISMLNKDEPIKLDKEGLLTKKSRQLISKNIKEKLGSYTMWKKESIKIENIIQTQAYNLKKTVEDNSIKYKPFIGKF
jgi:group II intron reverse transcriptase/maturase/CRISPR-associated endonuclease Cas1